MVSFVGRRCVEPWAMTRLLHLPGAGDRRGARAFSNDQWAMAGAQLLTVRYWPGWPSSATRPRCVTVRPCRGEVWRTMDQALATFPRDGFDYVWLIQPPLHDPRLTAGPAADLAKRHAASSIGWSTDRRRSSTPRKE